MTTKDQEPKEYPKHHSILFVGPSPKSIALFNYLLRYEFGATPWSYPIVDLTNLTHQGPEPIPITQETLPEEYPIKEITGTFGFYEYENSPWGRQDVYKHVTGYGIDLVPHLRNPHPFGESEARRILTSLQENTGLGQYRQLENGKHQIVIPDRVTRQIWAIRNYQKTEGVAAILELGYDNPDRGIRYLQSLRDEYRGLLTRWDEEYLEERIEKLGEIKERQESDPSVNFLSIRLKSGEVFTEFADKGDNNQIEGRTKDLGVQKEVTKFFFSKAEFLLEAICNTLDPKQRRPVWIRVQHPDANLIPNAPGDEIIGKPPKRLLDPDTPLDDWASEAGKVIE